MLKIDVIKIDDVVIDGIKIKELRKDLFNISQLEYQLIN